MTFYRFEQLFRLITSITLVFILGCALTTTYGKRPKQDALNQDVYAFTIYYNAYTSSFDVHKKAKEEIKKFMDEQGYGYFEIVNVECTNGKCIYQVKFSTSTNKPLN